MSRDALMHARMIGACKLPGCAWPTVRHRAKCALNEDAAWSHFPLYTENQSDLVTCIYN
jgi:hypothetical protein